MDMHEFQMHTKNQAAQRRQRDANIKKATAMVPTAGTRKTADYSSVRRKGSEIYRAGGVEPLAIGATFSEADVTSTSGRKYRNLLSFASGDTSVIEDWTCECPWGKWNYDRSSQYKHLEHRKCSHSLAHYYYLLAFKSIMPGKN